MSERGKTRPAAARPRPVASRARLPEARGGLPAHVLWIVTILRFSAAGRRLLERAPALYMVNMTVNAPAPSASTCTGRSACRSARIATSTAMSATPASTSRASCARSWREIAATAARVPGRTVSSIFFGGGTPSLMQPATVRRDPRRHRASTGASRPSVEVTLEANPTSVEATRFRGYRAAGVNRVSLGVQALDDAALKELGRLHTRAGSARRGRRRACDLRALFVRSDLCAAAADARRHGQAELKRAIARSGRASLALSTDHRAGHAVLRPARGRQARHARREIARAISTT